MAITIKYDPMTIVGRKKEQQILKDILNSKQAEFIAVYGRRRVGKTYLIEQSLSNKGIYLSCSGLKDGNLHDQLLNFIKSFQATFHPGLPLKQPANWRSAFELLTTDILKISPKKKIIIFLDELPWMATRKSKFIQQLDYFWNNHWRKLPNFKLIACGSAASWILDNLINAKGGLYNRITRSMLLEPFNLLETKQYLKMKGFKLNNKQVLDLYMVMGGIPFYLNQNNPAKSIIQNIDEICFKKDGLLTQEFPRLFKSLFDNSEIHQQIIRILAQHRYGLSLKELAKKMKMTLGGRLSSKLKELESSSFIQKFLPYGKEKRNNYYKIIDEYTLFYIHWIEEIMQGKTIPSVGNYWSKAVKSPSWNSWSGYSFELICHKHADHIIKKLGLDSIGCFISHWTFTPTKGSQNTQGAQIDLLFDRADNAITLCEIKYSSGLFSIDKTYAKNLINKMEVFEQETKTTKQLFLAMITAQGLKKTIWSDELVAQVVSLEDLFVEL